MKARLPFPLFRSAILPLAFCALVSRAEEPALSFGVPEDVRSLLRDAQAAALPSSSVVTQDVGAVSVAPATTNAAAWFAAVGDGAALAFEDPATDETVVTNPVTGGAARLAPEPDYDEVRRDLHQSSSSILFARPPHSPSNKRFLTNF